MKLEPEFEVSSSKNKDLAQQCTLQKVWKIALLNLTDGIFETGVYAVPSKSQNSTVLGQGGPSSTQCSNPSWA